MENISNHSIDVILRYLGMYDIIKACVALNVDHQAIIDAWPLYNKARHISSKVTPGDFALFYQECPDKYRDTGIVTKTQAGTIWYLPRHNIDMIPILSTTSHRKNPNYKYLRVDDVVLQCISRYMSYSNFVDHKNQVHKRNAEASVAKATKLQLHQLEFQRIVDLLCREYNVSSASIENDNPHQYKQCFANTYCTFTCLHVSARALYMINLMRVLYHVPDRDIYRIRQLRAFTQWIYDTIYGDYTFSQSNRERSILYANIIHSHLQTLKNIT